VKIFSVSQIKAWDAYTIQHEPVSSIELMERAATACFNWVSRHFDKLCTIKIFCGKGNNGGDGLAIARLLIENGYRVFVYVVENYATGSPDFEVNLKRLQKISNKISFLEEEASFPEFINEIIIDALFGTGLNKKPTGIFANLIEYINAASQKVISIDVPSGLLIDGNRPDRNNQGKLLNDEYQIIKAAYTLTFQNQKLAFLMPENESFTGEVVLLDIQLNKEFEQNENSNFEWVDKNLIYKIYSKRNPFANKGNYGYACLLAGSYGMMGAAVLSSRACLRSGVGKLTCYTCNKGYGIMQVSVPEAMCKTFGNNFIKNVKKIKDFDVVGIGPGIGIHASHKNLLQNIFKKFKKPIVIDADALNVLSENPGLYALIPSQSILTPHPKEFERLFGKSNSDLDRIHLALSKSKKYNILIVLKGHFTFIASPDGKGYFNSTGNAGMATAGAGDVLTGIITGLLAQKYSPLNACLLGVYLHGMAGDIAAKKLSEEALIAGDINYNLGAAFKEIRIK
jgi:ADP-dependent NAD(P)H-hydrate dehydratase / NAD(P)H-hydrate epimerase